MLLVACKNSEQEKQAPVAMDSGIPGSAAMSVSKVSGASRRCRQRGWSA
jgi:hypothetical protein